jgi:uncharacterized oligopeptide transporter (OPT) family protein
MQQAYGFGEATFENPNPLAAPQAAMMASVARGVITGDLPYEFVGVGMAFAVLLIAFNVLLTKRYVVHC